MNLSKEKKQQLVLVALVTLMVISGLIFGLIRPQYRSLAGIAASRRAAETKFQQVKKTVTNASAVHARLIDTSNALNNAESDIASGDVYSWTYELLRRFKASYQVDIPDIGQPSISDMNLLPNFPYRQSTVTISGTAYYHDLGKFIADFENKFPHIRLVNLVMEPVSGNSDSGNEKLSFRMDLITLVKGNPANQ
jgi:Tfp pilus assembly protein PilO